MRKSRYKHILWVVVTLFAFTLSVRAATTGPAGVPQGSFKTHLPAIINGSAQGTAGTLQVHAAFDDGSGGAGESAGAGVIIRLDGHEVGATGASGMATIEQPTGQYTLQAVLPSLAIGSQNVTVTAGQTTNVTVILDGNAEVIEPSELVLDELVNGGLPLDTPTITLRFVKNGTTVAVNNLEEVELGAVNPDFVPFDMTFFFEVTPAGTVRAIDASVVTSFLTSLLSDARLRVSATDARGFSYHEVVTFVPGIFQVEGQLAAPPSQPSLPIGGLSVQATFVNGIETTVTSDAEGKFQLLNVPAGMLNVSSVTVLGGNSYTGSADISVDGDKQLLVRMLGLADILNNVPPWEVSPLPAASSPAPTPDPNRAQRKATNGEETHHPTAVSGEVQVSVSSAAENAPISGNATLDVAMGTQKVILKYEIQTAEYPEWVLQQSRYNDTWQLKVLSSSGAELFSAGSAVNAQLYSPPTWNSAGSTGELQEEIDVAALAANSDIQLTLYAVSTNIGDDLLATTVNASLGEEETIVINTITNDTVVPTEGGSDRFSIPRPGQQNTFQRTFDVTFTKPDDVEITAVTAELLDNAGGVLQTVVDEEAPGSAGVEEINDTTLRIEVTFSDNASQVASTPPPTDQIRYRFTLKGQNEDGDELESEPKESAAYFALWRMPDGLARYGMRDQGHDDWAAQSTYTWLTNNQNLVTRIDDISGEHARDIGHQTHHEGRDIDMFHVYTFPNGAVSGTQNYLRLMENVRAALGGDAQALARVNAWASQTQDRFDDLIADNNVVRIYYAIGSANQAAGQPVLTGGWAQELLENGTYTNPAGLAINLAAGAWANAGDAKMRYNAAHNNHFHVALNP